MRAAIGTSTKDIRFAAALGTMGVPIELRVTLDEQSGKRTTRFHLALQSVDRADWQTKRLIDGWRSGRMLARTPEHPFAVIMLAFANRSALLDCVHNGRRLSLQRIAAGVEVWGYAPSDTGLPGRRSVVGGEVIRTGDLKMAAALGTVGLPVVEIEGDAGHRRFYLPRFGPARQGGLPPVDGLRLMLAWREDRESVPWEDPFAQAARGLYNRERLLDAVNREVELVMLRKPRSLRSAIVRADASAEAWDKVKDHFDA